MSHLTCLWPAYFNTKRERFCGRPAELRTVVADGIPLGQWRERVGFMPWARPMVFGTLLQVCYCRRHARELLKRLGGRTMLTGETDTL